MAMFIEQGLIPKAHSNRLVAALRKDPKLLIPLMKETMFRGCFLRDANETLFPDLGQDLRLAQILADLMAAPERLINDPERFTILLDEYERRMPAASTVLCRWTADGTHENYGPGSRPDDWSFLAELAVWFAARGILDLPDGDPSR
jgi:hypothetical protein